MREHALPQDVTGYKFHIIGNMTLKQFLEVGAGCVIAFLIFQTNLPNFIKLPVMAFSAGLGAMMAFVPIEERPLDQWITALFKALYRPTQYYWKRDPKIPEPFLYQPQTTAASMVGEIDLSPARRQRVKEYLRSITVVPAPDQYETYSNQRVDEVMQFFTNDTTLQSSNTFAQPNAIADQAVDELSFVGRASGDELQLDQVSTQSLETDPHAQEVLELFDTTAAPVISEQVADEPTASVPTASLPVLDPATVSDVSFTTTAPAAVIEDVSSQLSSLQAAPVQVHNVFDSNGPAEEHLIAHIIDEQGGSPTSTQTPPTAPVVSPQATHQEVVIPETQKIRVQKMDPLDPNTPQNTQPTQEYIDTTQVTQVTNPTEPQVIGNLQQVTSNANLPFPDKPDTPNKIVGMVITPQNQPVPNAIVEILTPTGLPARAVKTNPFGQFFITTPLSAGEYVVRVEKDGLQFADRQLTLNDQIIDPLELRAS